MRAANYLHDGSAGKGTKSVTFRPSLPVSGTYEVSMWWPTQQTAYAWASNAPVDIASGTGLVTVVVSGAVVKVYDADVAGITTTAY